MASTGMVVHYMPVIPSLRQEDHDFQATVGCTAREYLKTQEVKKKKGVVHAYNLSTWDNRATG
jgi:hypothetical protein